MTTRLGKGPFFGSKKKMCFEVLLDVPGIYLLGQRLNFQLFGITYLVGKIKFKLLASLVQSIIEA